MSDRFIEAHLRAAVESAPSGLLMTDADGRLVLVNREIERMFGYAREELLGQPIERLVPERMRGAHPAFRTGFRNDPRVRSMGAGRELFGVRKDGTEVPVEIGLTPLATEDGLYILAAVVDISERKRLEAEQRQLNELLRQSQKMEAIGTLAGGIAHDFNNILGGIIGYAELVLERLDDAETISDMREIHSAAMRGRQLVNRILTFSRRQDAERRPLDLGDIVREVQQLLRATLPAGIELRVELDASSARVLADATSVHQVLMNLASNASQAMPGGGHLELGVHPLYVRDSVARANPGLREGAYMALEVRDSGIGMDEATRTRAFEPFFTTKPAGSGTGLGLAMVHGIMHEHGGAVLLESKPGEGTMVRCLFPATEAAAEARSAVKSLPTELRGRGERILIVDDEQSLLGATARRLEHLGYAVRSTTRPATALAMVQEAPGSLDLLITDLSMPEMSGAKLASDIHALNPAIPILLLSGYMDQLGEDVMRAAGIRAVLQKPVVVAELARACRAAIDRTAQA